MNNQKNIAEQIIELRNEIREREKRMTEAKARKTLLKKELEKKYKLEDSKASKKITELQIQLKKFERRILKLCNEIKKTLTDDELKALEEDRSE